MIYSGYRHFNNETTRSSVLRAVADTGNEAVWRRMFDLYAGFVFSIAHSKGLNANDADDIVQTGKEEKGPSKIDTGVYPFFECGNAPHPHG